jgi:RHS repeat-associated protein
VDEAVAAGADAVELNKPVNVYTENFLGFSVGSTVPSGYYDRKSAAWVASDNGRVVGIVSIANGVADVDVDGDGLADEAAASSLGITDEERRSLAGLYVAGQTLWRVPVLHFTPYDFNWPYRGPADAEFPDMPRPSPDDPVENQSCQAGSIIECESLTLGESIPISGTPFTLHYRSRSSPGFRAGRELEIPVSKAAVPASLKRIEVDLIVAGQHIHSTLPPLPNQKQTFRWDARDAYGRMLYANRAMTVRIIYRYDAVYVGSGLASRAFAAAGQQFDINPARNEVSYSQEYTVRLRGPRPDQGFGGWSLDALHSYESDNQLLHLGTGSDIKFEARATTPETTVPPFLTAQVVRVGPDGSIYAAASPCGAVIRLFPSGQVQVLGGTGSLPASDGATATSVRLCVRKDMGIASNGDVMFIDASENGTQTIFRLRDGVLRLLAKVPSNFALFSLAVAPSGVVYFTHENDLERVDAGGNVSVVAAADASRRFRSVRVGQDGNLYVWVDEGVPFGNDDRIYRWPLPGDPKAVFNIGNETVLDYTADRDGRLYFLRGLDSPCNGCTQVRIVDTDGTIRNYFNALSFLAPGSIALNPKGEIVYTDTCRSGPVGRCIFIGDTTAALTDSTGWIAAIAPRQEAFRFTNVGQHVETRDSVTNALIHRFSYDQRGFPVTTVNADGLLTRIERAATGEATAIIAPNGDRTELVYGADGRLAGADGPGGQHHEFTYTPDGLLQSYANPRGSTSTYEYDSLGRLKRASNATGGVKQLTFSSPVAGSETVQLSTGQGRLWRYTVTKKAEGFLDRTITIPSGLVTSASVAPLLTTAVLPDGTTTRLERKSDAQWGAMAPLTSAIFVTLPSGLRMITRLTSSIVLSDPTDPLSVTATTDVINVNGANSTITFTAGDRKVHAVSPLGRVIESFLDINGRVREVRLPGIASTVLTRDARGRLESITQGARQARIEWDAGDQVEALTDPTGRATHFTRDAAGRVTTVLLPDSRMIEYSYDENGNVLSIKPPGRPIHEFTYDAADRPLTYTAPGGDPPARYSYSPDGDLQRIVLPGEEEVTLGYDSGGRLSSIVMPAGSYSYSYLGGGQVGSISDPGGGRVALAWNGSLPTGTTWTGAVAGSVSFDWDSSFRLTSETTAGANVAFAYDADGLLTKAGALTMTRDSQTGLLTGTSIGNVSESFGYNEFGELVSLTASRNGGAVLSLSYERDTAGRITSITEGGGTRHFDYDPAGRLMRVTIDGTAMAEYDYDANGNRTAHRYVGGTSLGTYDDRDRLLTYEGTTYTYSRSGDLYSKTEAGVTTTYAYDAVGNLRKVILPTGSTIEYVIDGQNRRIGKKVDGTLVRGWLYSGQLQIVAELGAGSSVISRFVYGSRTNVPDYMIRSGVTYRILGDHLGSPRLVVNVTDGTVMEALTYDEFGNVLSDTNPGFQPFGFAGGLYDRDTGLVRFGARDYDPHTGRWTAKDPLLFGGGDTNLYAYALQDPVNFIDPSGELFRGVIPAGEGLGQAALNSYADTLTDPRASAAAKVASAIGGTFAALWTPCTSDRTFGTLLAAYGASGVLGSTANFGTWMENPVLYEFGQKTLRDAAFGELGTLSVIERGSAILKGGILNAVFNLGGNWLKTLGTGPTPGAALGLLGGGIVEGVMGRPSNCGCQ